MNVSVPSHLTVPNKLCPNTTPFACSAGIVPIGHDVSGFTTSYEICCMSETLPPSCKVVSNELNALVVANLAFSLVFTFASFTLSCVSS